MPSDALELPGTQDKLRQKIGHFHEVTELCLLHGRCMCCTLACCWGR